MTHSKKGMGLLNDVMSLIHPDLYHAGREAVELLKQSDLTRSSADRWPSIWTGVSLIANRITKSHVDKWGSNSWYDFLVSIGSYENAYFDLPDVGLKLEYLPGTGVAFCSKFLQHSVKEWGGGDRLCYAMFMRHNVLYKLQLENVGWMTQDRYKVTVGS
jgi:hypothetical protein